MVFFADAIGDSCLSLGRDGVTLFALSGIRSHADVVKYEKCGARGILVGEYLMKSGDIATTVKDLLQNVTRHSELGDLPLLPPLAKVCGITTVEYALAALRNGANMIGIIMAEHSPRYVHMEEAKAIAKAVREYGERTGPILPDILEAHLDGQSDWFHRNVVALREACSRAPLVVGVFANKSAAEMNAAAEEIGLDLVQLHGDEGFEICKDIKYPTIRALHLPDTALSDGVDAEAVLQQVHEGFANYILLDTTMKGQQGGTGVAFDWKIATIFTHARIPCLMAGGLTPENVVKALSVGHPVGVNVSSGVELKGSPGVKDLDKVAAFLKAVKDYLSVAALKIDEEKETIMPEVGKRKRVMEAKWIAVEYWGRTDECLERKWAHMEIVDELFESREELILATTLRNAQTVLEPNMFPYDTPDEIEHWTLWSRREMEQAEIEMFVRRWVLENAPQVKSWNYDENSSRSFDIFHVHVYLQGHVQHRRE
ncbi:N-5'phosphoribosyl anthranilate isomerase/indole-3-glycerol phosphate synthase [Phytophthora palmivora]|uniref:N-5'phosphoribosyl anthranilate isomerase/indole-3-glycerol phosphate synthase n=1 Tax=Phytophthora palmivora TaxID=4796 RepID=A0A2P4XI92_9STRA|nr:N-5'phosphoribosyl anthranilate isomerase/indole-3-glycerol phosphate synthase [Phytophthora palmivora]